MSSAMRYRAQDLVRRSRPCRTLTSPPRRFVQIAATPSSTNPTVASAAAADSSAPDAQFEVLGSPFSLLSASISASQNLYTRKGSLVGFHGNAESTVSSLSVLEPFRRAAFGIPFLYQKVTSTAPYTALISSKSPLTTFSVIHLDGRLDWMIAQRNALLAWTGHTLSIKPQINTSMSLAHWGSSRVTGRGLLCLSGKGQIYQLALKSGDEYIVHPSNVIAYSIMQHAPQPYRFKSSNLRLQIPNAFSYLPDTRFFKLVRQSNVWRFLANTLFSIRTWARRSIWGDRMFLRFQGPANILVQSRGAKLTDAFTARDVNEAADAPAGVLQAGKPVTRTITDSAPSTPLVPTKLSYATVQGDGKVTITKS